MFFFRVIYRLVSHGAHLVDVAADGWRHVLASRCGSRRAVEVLAGRTAAAASQVAAMAHAQRYLLGVVAATTTQVATCRRCRRSDRR